MSKNMKMVLAILVVWVLFAVMISTLIVNFIRNTDWESVYQNYRVESYQREMRVQKRIAELKENNEVNDEFKL